MRIHICAVGRLRAGPEKALIDDYLARFDATGRGLGLSFGGVKEADERKTKTTESGGAKLTRLTPDGALVWLLDERGAQMNSPDFAAALAQLRDGGTRDVAFAIGGADGVTAQFRANAQRILSFGPMVFPHMLIRVMLAEQLYRAGTILAGGPYHRA